MKDRNHNDVDEPFSNQNITPTTHDRQCDWKGCNDCERLLGILMAPQSPEPSTLLSDSEDEINPELIRLANLEPEPEISSQRLHNSFKI